MYMQPDVESTAQTVSKAAGRTRKIEAETCPSLLTILVSATALFLPNWFEINDLTPGGKPGRAIAIPNVEQRTLNLLLSPPGRPHPDPGLFFACETPCEDNARVHRRGERGL